MLKYCPIALGAIVLITTNANASPHRYQQHYQEHYAGVGSGSRGHISPRYAYGSGEVVAHPANCPRTLFCGCGAARELGLSDRALWLVGSWYKFPRAAAAPGTAALWGGRHVAVIREVHGDGTATVYDANSGGGLTRVHRISLAGLTIVDPHGGGGSMLASRQPAPIAHHAVGVRVTYRQRPSTRNAIAENWPAYRPDGEQHSRGATWRVARAESSVGFWH